MKFSTYNIFEKIKDSNNYILLNALSGNADIIESSEAEKFLNSDYSSYKDEMIEKGYLCDPEKEEKLIKEKYLSFIEERDASEIQLFYVPHYSCNFNCSYCYQDQYENTGSESADEVTDAFYRYIKKEFSGRKKYITVFGGEPLLPDKHSRRAMELLIEGSNRESIDLAIVTNGYHLSDYIDLLKKARIREVQVTLDGIEEIHDKRRYLKNNAPTFQKIVAGINECLAQGLSINMRVVLDRENIYALPRLAQYAKERGWTKNPLFKTQLGRNYELHHCQSEASRLFSRVELYETLYELLQEHPVITEFHRPAYSVSRFLFDNGELPAALFDSCPGCKTEWAFDYTGTIYSCTATVGKSDEALGSFYPEIHLNEELVEEWEDRDVLSIPECRECSSMMLCGGGCASIAKNKTGKIKSPDCRPVKELLQMGISLYHDKGVIQ